MKKSVINKSDSTVMHDVLKRVKPLIPGIGIAILGTYFCYTSSETLWAQGTTNSYSNQQEIQTADTTRYSIIINGHLKGERRMWQEGPGTWHYEYEGNYYDSYQFPRKELLVLDAEGLPIRMEISGQMNPRDMWDERFERNGRQVSWTVTVPSAVGLDTSRSVEKGDTAITGPGFYAALHPVHDAGVLARALKRCSTGTLPLIPDGEAQLEPLDRQTVAAGGQNRVVRLYAIHGLDLRPIYVWLDEEGATFADEWSIRSGWEEAFTELRIGIEKALAEHHLRLAAELLPKARERPLAIRGARLFNPKTRAVHSDMTIVVEGNRIGAVDADGKVDVPTGAEVIEAEGQMVLPGLWDMHAHHGIPSNYLELNAPLHLAGGITTARDLGSHTEPILSLKERIQSGEALGPRLLLAGLIEGEGGQPTGVLVGNAAEARAAVDHLAELGYVQINLYHRFPPELVPVVIDRATQHGLRVSGYVPNGMTVREVVESGFDEIRHIVGILGNLVSIPDPMDDLDLYYDAWIALKPDSKVVGDFIQLLASRGIAIDPNLANFRYYCDASPPWVKDIANGLPPSAKRRLIAASTFPQCWQHPLLEESLRNLEGFVLSAHEAGVPVLPGSDLMPGFGLHQDLVLCVQGGIPAPEVLTLATLGAARVMNLDNELGSVEPGKLADLILVDGDPTTDITDIRRVVTVIKDGRVYDPGAIYESLGISPCCEE